MNKITLFCALFALFSVVEGQLRQCVSVNGRHRRCIPIYDCEPLSGLVRKQNRTQQDVSLLKSSHCGYKMKTPAVCCPLTSGSKCYTPESKLGNCVGLKSCRDLQRLLLPPLMEYKIQYVERSKCEGSDQYSVCCPVPYVNTVRIGKCETKLSAFPPDPASECCGVASYENKIIGGTVASIDQYPWLVNIEYGKDGTIQTRCIGALISGRYVLTTAHCVQGPILEIGTPETIRLGDYDLSKDGSDCTTIKEEGIDCTEGETRISIQKTIVHPEYDEQLRKNDIALIRMAALAPYTDFIRPICLTRGNITKTSPLGLTLAGWAPMNVSTIKMQASLRFVNRSKCQEAYNAPGRRITLLKSHICAGDEAHTVCMNGVLMYQNRKVYELIGISSFGPTACGLEDVPDVFTNVYEYHPWIRSNIVP